MKRLYQWFSERASFFRSDVSGSDATRTLSTEVTIRRERMTVQVRGTASLDCDICPFCGQEIAASLSKANTNGNQNKNQPNKENQMKAIPKVNNSIVFAALLACLIVAGTGSASARKLNQVLRVSHNQTFVGECCFSFGESVSITEPAAISAVVVTWNSDYVVNVGDEYHIGISVNGGECVTDTYGSVVLADADVITGGNGLNASIQWIVLPSDEVLKKGTNTFELCGGGRHSSSDSISLGTNTLTVAIGN
jgi:hypothetical protein